MRSKVYDAFTWISVIVSLTAIPLYLSLMNGLSWYYVVGFTISPIVILALLVIVLSLTNDFFEKRKKAKELIKNNKEEKKTIKEIMKEYKDYDWSYANSKATHQFYQSKIDLLKTNVTIKINSKEYWIERYLKDLKDLIELANNDLDMGVTSEYINNNKSVVSAKPKQGANDSV